MKHKSKLLMLTIASITSLTINSAFGQATGNNAFNAAWYLGWSTSNPLPFKLNGTQYLSLTTAGDFDITNAGNGITLAGNKFLFTKGHNTNLCVGITAGNSQGGTQGDNTFTGYQSGYNTNGNIATLVGLYNTFIGSGSAFTNTASCNNAHGYQSLYNNTNGYANVGIGVKASYNGTTGSRNIAIGDSALFTNSTGHFNTASGYQALYLSTVSNLCAFGHQALKNNSTGTYNNAFGYNALMANQTGNYSNAFGYNALASSTGSGYNDAFGYNALTANTTGYGNLAMGYKSMAVNTTGSFNTAVGVQTLQSVTSASYCAGFGFDALTYNTTGSNNTASGFYPLYFNTSGNDNTSSGYYSLYNNTTGAYNTAIGSLAGYNYSTGNNNTFLGYGADANANNYSNSTAIGNGALINNSNDIRLGNTSIASLRCNVTVITTSDLRVKDNIVENVPGLNFIKLLKPVTYHLNVDKQDAIVNAKDSLGNTKSNNFPGKYEVEKIQFTGFIAQDVEKSANQIGYNFSGLHKPINEKDIYGIAYSDFVPPLVKAVQELSKIGDSLKIVISKQDSVNKSLQNQINKIIGTSSRVIQNNNSNNNGDGNNKGMGIIDVQLNNSNAVILNEAVPNPFAEQTVISYNIPTSATLSQILFYDANGNLIKSVDIKTSGKGQLNVFANDLTNGIYSYTLIVDGKIFGTKKMIKQ